MNTIVRILPVPNPGSLDASAGDAARYVNPVWIASLVLFLLLSVSSITAGSPHLYRTIAPDAQSLSISDRISGTTISIPDGSVDLDSWPEGGVNAASSPSLPNDRVPARLPCVMFADLIVLQPEDFGAAKTSGDQQENPSRYRASQDRVSCLAHSLGRMTAEPSARPGILSQLQTVVLLH